MVIYFGVRSCMLLAGADLNGKFEVVWSKNAESDRINPYSSSHNSRLPRNSREIIQMPTTAEECYKQIGQLKRVLVTILAYEANVLHQTCPSFREVRKSLGNNAIGEQLKQKREGNDPKHEDDEGENENEQEPERQHQYKHQYQHQQQGLNNTETSKILPVSSSI